MIAVREEKSLLAFDAAFPGRDQFLCAEEMSGTFSKILKTNVESCEIVRIKYRPQTSLRAAFRVKSKGKESIFTARIFPDDRAKEIYETSENKKAIFHDERLKTVFWKFPFDRKIKRLEAIFKSKHNSRLVAYAPEKCATFCYSNAKNEPFAYAKIFADADEGERIFSVYKNLPRTENSLFPNAVYYSPEQRTLVVEAVRGVCFADLQNEEPEKSFRLFGAAVAHLHKIRPLENLKEFSRHQPHKIAETLENTDRVLPDHFEQAKNLAERLNQTFNFEAEEKITLHGDVHPKNALLSDGENLTLIDLDQMSVGNAASDIGSFLAGLFYKEITGEISAVERKNRTENFLKGYQKMRDLPDKRTLNWHTATAFFTERCSRSINRFRVEGLKNFGALLSCAEEVLAGKTF